jgi:hypothetical protein
MSKWGAASKRSRRIIAGDFSDILCGEKPLLRIIITLAEMKRGLDQPESIDPFTIMRMLSV